MPDTPVVSVILPVRNAAGTVGEALQSVLSQTFRQFEVIAVDDGSTDGSGDVLRTIAARDSRVHPTSSNGSGLAASLNLGIARAQGRFIARQDADDISMPERFERQVASLDQRRDICAIGTQTIAIDAAGRAMGRLPIRYGTAQVRRGLRSARTSPTHGSMMIRRECLQAVGGYREAFVTSQDFDLWLRLLERWQIDNLEEPLYAWRLTRSSVYGARRQVQLLYSGVAITFAAERQRYGADSYELFERRQGDLEAFAEQYRLEGLLRANWGELLLRGLDDARLAHRQLRCAVRRGHARPRTVFWWGWTSMGLRWPGSRPLRAADVSGGIED